MTIDLFTSSINFNRKLFISHLKLIKRSTFREVNYMQIILEREKLNKIQKGIWHIAAERFKNYQENCFQNVLCINCHWKNHKIPAGQRF